VAQNSLGMTKFPLVVKKKSAAATKRRPDYFAGEAKLMAVC